MKEYTFIAVGSVILTVLADRLSGVNILKQRLFYLFLLVILVFKLLVNGYLTGTNIVIYNPKFFLGFRIGSIPLEDFLFGFSMVSLGVIFWEFSKRRQR
ncbi:MAG: lycopene cyclase domain-containing protein [Candidatus Omnitrophica bacterium]|nr:lycopene cyclase domain-containing protein [Candidatus Omnitrophota bacterium]